MKNILILLFGILLVSCNQKNKSNPEVVTENTEVNSEAINFDWLLGKWKRTNEEEGKYTFENWKKINDTEYKGIGFTMQNGDTIKQESIKLIYHKGSWNLKVKVPEDSEFITFKGISFSKNEFICENNELEFPNKIKYWKNGEKINASVSGGDFKISFEFEKLN